MDYTVRTYFLKEETSYKFAVETIYRGVVISFRRANTLEEANRIAKEEKAA